MMQWNSRQGYPIWLFTIEEFNQLSNGTELESIMGDKVIKGIDIIDEDIRFGHMAYGVDRLLGHPESELFTVFKLS